MAGAYNKLSSTANRTPEQQAQYLALSKNLASGTVI